MSNSGLQQFSYVTIIDPALVLMCFLLEFKRKHLFRAFYNGDLISFQQVEMLSLISDIVIVVQVKSRMMGGKGGAYKGTVDCFIQTFKNDVRASILLRRS